MAVRRPNVNAGNNMWNVLNPENPRPTQGGDVLADAAIHGPELAGMEAAAFGAAGAPTRGRGQPPPPQPPANPFPEIRRQTTPRAAKPGLAAPPNLFPPAPMPMLPVAGGGDKAADDARFRGLEKQCADLREEQRQMAGWLSKTQEELAQEAGQRKALEGALAALEGRQAVGHSELGARIATAERQNQSLQDGLQWSQGKLQDEIGKVASEVGAVALDVQGVSSTVKVQQDSLTQLTDELATLERVSRTVSFLQEQTELFNRTLDQRLLETEQRAKSMADAADSRAAEAMKQAQTAGKTTHALEQHVQRQTDQLNTSLRRLETSLKSEVLEAMTARSREVTEGLVVEMEAKIGRDMEAALSNSSQDTSAVLRRELDERIKALGEAVQEAQSQRSAQDEQMRSELRAVLVQQKTAVQQVADETGKRLRAVDESLRAEATARQALEGNISGLMDRAQNDDALAQQRQEEVLAIEESLEAGLSDLRGELSSSVGALAERTDERDRERGHEMSRMHTELSSQLSVLKKRDTSFFETSKQIAAIADATRANHEKQIDLAERTEEHTESMQQMRHVVSRVEEKFHRWTRGAGPGPAADEEGDGIGGVGGGGGGGVLSQDMMQRMADALQAEGRSSDTCGGFPALRHLWGAFEDMDSNWDMLEAQLAQATEERRLNAETIAGTGESLEAIINRLYAPRAPHPCWPACCLPAL